MVPSKENNAVFWMICRVCPAASAEPPGAKLPAKVRIEPSGMPPGSACGSWLFDGKIPERELRQRERRLHVIEW
jgi:hypothetical protein